jgi:hypothetical protein
VSKNSKIFLVLIIILLLLGTVFAYKIRNNSNNQLTPSQKVVAKNQIIANWTRFFNRNTSLQEREQLLVNGPSFNQYIVREFNGLGTASPSIKIKSINFNNKSTANVTYSVYLNQTAVLNNQVGQTELSSNTWKISDSTLCNLLKLAGNQPPICKGQ